MIALAAMLLTHAGIAAETLSVAQQFVLFQNQYHKVYASPEIADYRQRIFAENLAKIQKHNAEKHAWRLGINEYADETWEEFSRTRLLNTNSPVLTQSKSQPTFSPKRITTPLSVNWRTSGAVTPVKNQGLCGSSWAFATTGVMESAGKIQLGTLHSLSEQEFLDCNTSNAACNGGQINNALLFAEGGITNESSYPYRAQAGSCLPHTSVLIVTNFAQVTPNDELALAAAVAIQPIAVGVEADAAVFQFYASGVVTSSECGTTLNQALLIVGYDTENGVPYWLCKNSWGSSWGDSGYIKIGRSLTASAGPGICGIASYPWSVTVALP